MSTYTHATENPFTISLKKSASSVTATVVSSKANIVGDISFSKGSEFPFKRCTAVFDSAGKTLPCTATGLVQKETYYVVAQASDTAGTAYKGVEKFVFGVEPAPATSPTTSPSTPPTLPPTQNPQTQTVSVGGGTTGAIVGATTSTPALQTQTAKELDTAAILADKEGNGVVPCHDTCGFTDVLVLINNVISFLVTKLFIPLVILMIMYTGVTYITAQGNPGKRANVKSMMMHIVVGMIFVLCSWLIVKTVLGILLRDPSGTLLQ